MSEKHVFSRAFITNWDFFCRAVRGVAGGCVPRLSPNFISVFGVGGNSKLLPHHRAAGQEK